MPDWLAPFVLPVIGPWSAAGPAGFLGLLGPHGPGAGLLLLAAIPIEMALGGVLLECRLHPARLAARAAAFFESRLNRRRRSERARLARGLVAALVIAVPAALAGLAAEWGLGLIAYGWVGELAVLVLTLGVGRPLARGARIARALKGGGPLEAYAALGDARPARLEGRGLDSHGIARRAIEICAGATATGLVGPALWFALLGLPGALVYRVLVAAVERLAEQPDAAGVYGLATGRLAAAMNAVPERLAGLLVAVAAVAVPSAAPHRGLALMLRSRGLWPRAAFAGALGLALAGPGGGAGGAWLGHGRARATALDLRRALLLYGAACLIFTAAGAPLALYAAFSG